MEQQVAAAGPNRAIEAGSGLPASTALGAGVTLGAGPLIAFATAPAEVALDGKRANSPFSAALSRAQTCRSRRRDQKQAGAMVELVTTRRGLSPCVVSGEQHTAGVRFRTGQDAVKFSAYTETRHRSGPIRHRNPANRGEPNGEATPSVVQALVGLEAPAISGSDPAKQLAKC
jgi:hypothetical protein